MKKGLLRKQLAFGAAPFLSIPVFLFILTNN